MKIAKVIGVIVGIGVLVLTLCLAWIGFGTCFVVNDHKSDDLAKEIAYCMAHPLE